MRRTAVGAEIRLPSHEEPASAVTIFDSRGEVVRIVPATEFRRGPIIRTGTLNWSAGGAQRVALDRAWRAA